MREPVESRQARVASIQPHSSTPEEDERAQA